jgi:hypothetical protein
VVVILSRRHKITIVLLAIYWAILTLLEHIPLPQLVNQAGVSDKWLHFLAYMNLVFFVWFSFFPDAKADWRKPAVWLILLGVIIYGGLDELTQPYTGRTCDIMDFVSDAEGILGGLIIFAFLPFWPSLLAVWAITIFGVSVLVKADISKLVPALDIIYHIVAAGGFAAIWGYFINLYVLPRTTIGRLLLTTSVPAGLILFVKVISMLLGRYFTGMDMALSGVAIVAVAIVKCLGGLSRQVQAK